MTALALHVAGWVLPILLGPIVYVVMQQVLNVHRVIDDLPPVFKRGAVAAFGMLLVAVLNTLGVAVPQECVAFPADVIADCAKALSGPTVVRGITAALVAFAIHAARKAQP